MNAPHPPPNGAHHAYASKTAPPTSAHSAAISEVTRLDLDDARTQLEAAARALDGWYARETSAAHGYVADGHDAIRLIDLVTRNLYRLRGTLIDELRVDEDERAARVDQIIADLQARRGHEVPTDARSRRDGGTA